MLNYNTTLPFSPPKTMPQLQGMKPYGGYGSSYDDVMRGQMSQANANYGVQASRAETDYALRQQDAERQLVLQGLQQMNEAQQNRNSLLNARLGGVSSLLSGLFR